MNRTRPKPTTRRCVADWRRVVDDMTGRLDRDAITLRLPRSRGVVIEGRTSHVHPDAEIFVQTSGASRLDFPEEHIVIKPSEVCIVPRNVAHWETCERGRGPFKNAVASFWDGSIGFHTAVAGEDVRAQRVHADQENVRPFLRSGASGEPKHPGAYEAASDLHGLRI